MSLLQQDASLSIKEIARQIHLSPTPCWKRIQKLEQTGIIRARVALLDAGKVNADVTVFVAIRTDQHSRAWLDRFAKVVRSMPEVVEIYRMSGDVDYLLRVVVRDIGAYDEFYKKLIERIELASVTSSFAIECIKHTTALPINL